MGDVTLAVRSHQRHGDPLDPQCGVALTRGGEDIPQRPLDPCIGGHQPPTDGPQDIAGGKNGAAGGIGVNEAPFGVDEIHAGAQPIEGIDECRDFAGLEPIPDEPFPVLSQDPRDSGDQGGRWMGEERGWP